MDLPTICTLLLGLVLLFIVLVSLYIYAFTHPKPDLSRSESERYYYDPRSERRESFPSLYDDSTVTLSVIVPSYNEEKRLPAMLDEAVAFLEDRQRDNPSSTYEFIVVDDGSHDNTSKVAMEYSEKYGSNKIRVLTFERNRGKGGAVRLGMFSGRGKYLLFADADGASKFSDIVKLEKTMSQLCGKQTGDTMAVVCGSRAHLEEDSIATRSLFRTILMHGFHFLVSFLCVRHIRDTQCGFKLLTRDAARVLFKNLHVNRWAFDVDLLYLAAHFKIACAEVPITWQEIDGSKMIPLFSWAQMGKDILMIRVRYLLGAWTIEPLDKIK